MTEPSQTHQQVVDALVDRWPEHRIAPTLGRIQALCDLLGDPHRACPVIHIAGTNGKGSTAIMIDALLRSAGLRTGRFTSPHLVDARERIAIDGEAISEVVFDELWEQVRPMVEIVDARLVDGVAMTFFEVMTGLAFAAFADAPVDVAILETGLGGTWDCTNVADGDVAVITPIDFDHMHILGDTIGEIASNKAGIIKPGATAVIMGQRPEAAKVLLDRCLEVGAAPKLEGVDFGLLDRQLAVGGQLLRIDTAGGPVGDLHLPLYGAHMARNAALAVAAVEAFLGGHALEPQVIADGLANVEAPARLETVHHSPTVVLDTGHNPHGVRATVDAMEESFGFTPLIGVVSMMSDKDVDATLPIFAEVMSTVVVTRVSSTDRGMGVDDLAERAAGVFGSDRVERAESMSAAIDLALRLADEAGPSAGVLVAGSVIGAGEARSLLKPASGSAARSSSDEPLWSVGPSLDDPFPDGSGAQDEVTW